MEPRPGLRRPRLRPAKTSPLPRLAPVLDPEAAPVSEATAIEAHYGPDHYVTLFRSGKRIASAVEWVDVDTTEGTRRLLTRWTLHVNGPQPIELLRLDCRVFASLEEVKTALARAA